jgi:RTX toxins and related Ca2+-binding proteins
MTTPITPAPITYAHIWTLAANPAGLDGAVATWRAYADQAERVATTIDTRAGAAYDGPWAGRTAEEFNQHRTKFTTDLRRTAALARRQADQFEVVAGTLRMGERALHGALTQLTSVVRAQATGSQITFYPQDEAQVQVVHEGAAHARQLRREIDRELAGATTALAALDGEWAAIARAWAGPAAGASPFSMPVEPTGTFVLQSGDTVIVNTGRGDDSVQIRVDPATGQQIVEVNGTAYRFPPGAAIVVRTGAGDDRITVAPGTNLRLTLLGGSGSDVIRGGDGDERILGLAGDDKIYAGGGNDRVSGGSGRDYIDGSRGNDILTGGEGDDVLYGLSGDDWLSGGADRDYLEGGTGRDAIDGGAHNDILSGGRDDDRLRGGAGSDRIYAGHGADQVSGGSGGDTGYAERGDRTSGTEHVVTVEIKDLGMDIRIEGSEEFRERVQADLDMLRSSPAGQQMLTELDAIMARTDGGDDRSLTIVGSPEKRGNHAHSLPWRGGFLWLDERERYVVEYEPGGMRAQDDRPPVAGLFHEFAHVYDYGNDTSAPGVYWGADNPKAPNRERAAVGLPVDLNGDGVAEGLYPDHPVTLTENALRREMGWPDRRKY